MSSAIQNIMEEALGDGARSTKFEVILEFSNSGMFDGARAMTLVKATSFPTKTHNIVEFMHKGRTIPLKGQTKYSQTWECTFYLTQDHKLKHVIETWMEAIDQKHNYLEPEKDANLFNTQKNHLNGSYAKTVNLYQYNFDGDQKTAEYQLKNVFPIEVSPIQSSYDAVGTVQEFTVTFAFSHFTMQVNKGPSGNFVDEIVSSLLNASRTSISNGISSVSKSISSLYADNVGDSISSQNSKYENLSEKTKGRGVNNTMSAIINGGKVSDKGTDDNL